MTDVEVALPHTCGELVQGWSQDSDVLITCPIRRRGRVVASLVTSGAGNVARLPPKTHRAVRHALRACAMEAALPNLRVKLHATAAAGKGMATSSVHVLGAIMAVGRLFGADWTPAEATQMALAVEPTDGIAFPGLALLDHRRGSRYELMGQSPPLGIVVLEPAAVVDTVRFNRDRGRRAVDTDLNAVTDDAIAMVRAGLAANHPQWIANGASLSAWHWQKVLPNPWLQPFFDWMKQQGGLGICRAHSGTVMGALFDCDRLLDSALLMSLRRRVSSEVNVWFTCLAGGGAG